MRPALNRAGRRPSPFPRRERDRRRIEPHFRVAVALHQRARIAGIGLQMQDARGMRVQHRIVAHLLERRQADHAVAIPIVRLDATARL